MTHDQNRVVRRTIPRQPLNDNITDKGTNMANYYEACRTNYFRVKDPEAFKAAMARIPSITVDEQETDGSVRFVILGADSDGDGWPSDIASESNPDEIEDLDFFQYVADHLVDDEVIIFLETSAEKLRYLTGYAYGCNNKGEFRRFRYPASTSSQRS